MKPFLQGLFSSAFGSSQFMTTTQPTYDLNRCILWALKKSRDEGKANATSHESLAALKIFLPASKEESKNWRRKMLILRVFQVGFFNFIKSQIYDFWPQSTSKWSKINVPYCITGTVTVKSGNFGGFFAKIFFFLKMNMNRYTSFLSFVVLSKIGA